MPWWKRSSLGPSESSEKKIFVPEGVWTRCDGCQEILLQDDIRENLNVCPKCNYHFSITVSQRCELILDPESFEPFSAILEPRDPLNFKDSIKYKDRIKAARKKSGLNEAVLAGIGSIDGRTVAVGFLAFEYMGGSMGSVVGEIITRVLEKALELKCPAVISSASGGARMQEGILSLMQMAKCSLAMSRLKEACIPFISVLHNPTTGGVAASFAMQGDVILAEPQALIGFAGPRVIEQTIKQSLPKGFQRSEFLLEHGMIDMIVSRHELRSRLSYLIQVLTLDKHPHIVK